MGNLIKKIEEVPKDKKLIVFDLDGTLAESKQPIDEEMVSLLAQLLKKKRVAVIGGGKYELFQKQLLSRLNLPNELSEKLFLFPTNSTLFYRYNNIWEKIYSQDLTPQEKKKIFDVFDRAFTKLNYTLPEKIYGEAIEDRGTQITFSALGQEAPLDLKQKWHKENPGIRSKMEEILQKNLPDMEVKVTGLTSIDVTRKGIDKAYGIGQISRQLNVAIEDILFVGDAFFHEGNDEAGLRSGVLCFGVGSVDDTKKLIKHLLNS